MPGLAAVVFGYATGIFICSLIPLHWSFLVFSFLLLALFCGAWILRPRLAYSLGAAFCLFAAIGMARVTMSDTSPPELFTHDLHHSVSYQGVVVSDPDIRDANQRVEIHVSRNGESTTILALAPRYPHVLVGDTVSVTGVLLKPQPFLSDGGRIFRYDKYLERDGVQFIFQFSFLHVIQSAPWYSPTAFLARIKHAFLDGLRATLPEPIASLAGGIVIGGKSGLGSDVQDAFVRSGLIQVIVLSGYNVLIIADWVMRILAYTKLSRRKIAFLGAMAILLFVGVAGFSATAVRALLMACIGLYARATGRSYVAGRALLATVFLMLLFHPFYLVFDPSFSLSVAATAGLIWLAPIIETFHFPFWKNAIATTLAAQIAVLPILLYDTGILSLVAVPANLLMVPIVPAAMFFSAIAGFAGIIFGNVVPLIGILFAIPAYLTNTYILFIAEKAAAFPLATFLLPPFPFVCVVLSYVALIFIASSKRFSTTDQFTFAKNASM